MENNEIEKTINVIDKNFNKILNRIEQVSLESKALCEHFLKINEKETNIFNIKNKLDCFNKIIDIFKK